MFCSVFDKVVSATAPDALATFPPRAALPVSSSTLCCLSFADRFISHYPTAYAPIVGNVDGNVNARLVGRAGVTGIAVSHNELELVMQTSAELGARLAATLAGTVRSENWESATAPVSDLLSKVRGIFGNRLICVGREIRVSRNVKAEREETLLLGQLHALKNAALEASNGEKWCIVVSSSDESLAVCSLPLPSMEEEGACGCDFLVFDPWPRPAMKLRGSYVVKFTTIRGLQLHLLSALGEVWREGDLVRKGGVTGEFVDLSFVVSAKGGKASLLDEEGRCPLEKSVTRLRKAEKAAAIKIKREEVEALRKALGGTTQNHPTTVESLASRAAGSTGGTNRPQVLNGNNLIVKKNSFFLSSENRRSREETPRHDFELLDLSLRENRVSEHPRGSPEGGDGVEASHLLSSRPKKMLRSIKGNLSKNIRQDLGEQLRVPSICTTVYDRQDLQPPTADISPPLSLQGLGREGQEPWSKDGSIENPNEEEIEVPNIMIRGRGVGAMPLKGEINALRFASEGKASGRVERTEEGLRLKSHGNVDMFNNTDAVANYDNLFQRALLRSIEGERVVEYSKRAYSIYRVNSVLQDGLLDEELITKMSSGRSLSLGPYDFHPATPSKVVPANSAPISGVIEQKTTDISGRLPADGTGEEEVVAKEFGEAEMVLHEPVRPFSPPIFPPTQLSRSSNPSNNRKEGFAIVPATRDDDLRVFDVSETKEVLTQTVEEAVFSPKEYCRSRIRVPRAGRVLALASTNARRCQAHRRQRSPNFRRDSSGNPLPPPPSNTALPVRRKEAWNDRTVTEQPPGDRQRGRRHESELAYSGTDAGVAKVASAKGKTNVKSAIPERVDQNPCSEGHQHNFSQPCQKEGEEEIEYTVSKEVRDNPGSARSPNRIQTQADREGSLAHKQRQVGRSIADEAHVSTVVPAFVGPSQQGANGARLLAEVVTGRAGSQLQLPRPKALPGKKNGVEPVPVEIMPCVICPGALYGAGDGKSEDVHSTRRTRVGDARNEPYVNVQDDDGFVWFGQPETPPATQPSVTGDRLSKACAKHPEDTGQSSEQQRQRFKAKILLQMEVSRHRGAIERAFRARKEEEGLRRAQLGAEVFERIKFLHRKPKLEAALLVPASSHPAQLLPEKVETHINNDAAGTKNPQDDVNRETKNATSPFGRGFTVEATGFRPGSHKGCSGLPEDALQQVFNVPVPDDAWRGAPKYSPESERAPNEVTPCIVAENPWRQIGQRVELKEVPIKRAPTPPPIRFDVTADELRVEEAGMGGEMIQEKARRQERFKALRARKIVEAEERQRDQKKKQTATKEAQRRTVAAATATAATAIATAAADEKRIQDAETEASRRTLAQQNWTVWDEDVTSARGNYAPRAPTARPPSSDVRNTRHGRKENGFATREGYSPRDNVNGRRGRGGGGNGTHVPVSSSARTALPVIRGFSRRSNRKLVRNAIKFLCLAGGHLQGKKKRVLEALYSHPASNFVLLLAHSKLLAFKGLYACNSDDDGTADHVFGIGPPQVDASMVSGFYKYNSAAREFREVPSKTLGKTTDAVSMEPTRLRKQRWLAAQPTP